HPCSRIGISLGRCPPICAHAHEVASFRKESSQLQQRIERCAWRLDEVHDAASRPVEHPRWYVRAVSTFVAGYVAPKNDELYGSSCAIYQQLLTGEGMPWVLDATVLVPVSIVCVPCTTRSATTRVSATSSRSRRLLRSASPVLSAGTKDSAGC